MKSSANKVTVKTKLRPLKFKLDFVLSTNLIPKLRLYLTVQTRDRAETGLVDHEEGSPRLVDLGPVQH